MSINKWFYFTYSSNIELKHFIAVGLIYGLTKQAITNIIAKYYKQPYKNSIISNVEHKGVSSYNRLLLLTRYTIADSWMYADMRYAIKNGAIGFYSFRGSSYPCQLCDDYAKVFHTFADPYPPYHNRCCCYAVPVYNK